jgi:hypothetical protein
VTHIKATLIYKDGESVAFESVQDLMEYITDNELICRCRTGENLLKIWNHDSEKFAIDSKPIHIIYIYDVYKAEVRHNETKTFHTREDFENFMCAMGATRDNVHSSARYSIFGSEIITSRYDCAISGLTPEWEEETY